MGARLPRHRSDRISAGTIPPRLFPGVATALRAAVPRGPLPPGFAAVNCDRMPSKALATEDLHITLEHAATPVLTVVAAALEAGVEVIAAGAAATAAGAAEATAAGDMRPSVHFGRFPFAVLAVLLLAMLCKIGRASCRERG